MVWKQRRFNRVKYGFKKCSTCVAVVAAFGVVSSTVPFIVGAPDFKNMPPPPHHGGPEGGSPGHHDGRPPHAPRDHWNPNEQHEMERQEEDRFDFQDEQYDQYMEERWEDDRFDDEEPMSDSDDEDNEEFHKLNQGRPDRHGPHGDKHHRKDPVHMLTDTFHRLNFFALMKWLCVLFAAIVGIRQSRKSSQAVKNKRKTQKPLRKARCLIFTASIMGALELWQIRNFHHGMHKMWEDRPEPRHGDKPITAPVPEIDADEQVMFLNEPENQGRNLKGDHHGDHHGDRHGDHHGDHHGKSFGKEHGKGHHGKHG